MDANKIRFLFLKEKKEGGYRLCNEKVRCCQALKPDFYNTHF